MTDIAPTGLHHVTAIAEDPQENVPLESIGWQRRLAGLDVLPRREHLAPEAPVLSVRGSVLENGMPRAVPGHSQLRDEVGAVPGIHDSRGRRPSAAAGSGSP